MLFPFFLFIFFYMMKRILLFLVVFSAIAFGRDVPVRYWVNGEADEVEAIFVKIQNDTVYLRNPNADELNRLNTIREQENIARQETNGQITEEDVDEDKPDSVEVIMTEDVKKAISGEKDSAEAAPVEDDGSGDDLETALEKEDVRVKHAEIAKVEEEIRQREIQDSIEAANANPFVKYYRLDLKRLFNLDDNVMIDLALSNYVVPELVVEDEKKFELYPPGKANLLVSTVPEACSLFVNGIPLNQTAPDTIKNIRPGKYTISIKRVIKGVEMWGSAVVKINVDSLNKVNIGVMRPSTRLTLNTDPEDVEVYINKEPSLDEMPHYKTDVMVDNIKPQPKISVHFRKVGYRDTTIYTEVKAFMPNLVNVDLQPVLDDLVFVEEQKAFDAERSQRRLGRGMVWSSIVPFIAGGVMWFLAERDWSDAADKKKAYNLSAFESEDTKQMVKDNRDLNKTGDIKGIIAAGLGVVGISLLSLGIVWAF